MLFLSLALVTPAAAAPLFTSAFRAFTTGDGPAAIAAGDMDGDGRQDLVVGNYQGNTVSVLLGDGSGGYAPAVDYDTGINPSWVEVVDLDNDGRLDIVTANTGDGTVSVILRNASGGYLAKVSYVVGPSTWGLAVGDFAGNARPDLAVAADVNGIALLTNAGNGTFGAPIYLAAPGASAMRLADLNGDAKLDLVSANFGGAGVSRWLWTGAAGIFGSRADYTMVDCNDVAVGDVTDDGIPDIVAAQWDYPGPVLVLPGIGGGAFGVAVPYLNDPYPAYVRIADFDGDLDLDVAVTNSVSHTISIFPNVPGPLLGTRTVHEASWTPYAMVVKDLNGDARPDVAVANSFTDVTTVLLNNGAGFGSQATFSAAAGSHFVMLADLDNDSRLDAVMGSLSAAAVHVRFGLPGGGFGAPSDFLSGATPQVAVGDLNGDLKPDFAAVDTLNNLLSVFLANGTGTFAPRVTYATRPVPGGIEIADVTGDGHLDVVVTNRIGDDVSIFPGNGTGALGARSDLAVGDSPFDLAVGDLNGDLRPDLVIACRGNGGDIMVLLGTGGGAFAAPVPYHVGRRVQSVALGHLNGDAVLDLVASSYVDFLYDQDFLSVYLGTGSGTFAAPTLLPTTSNPYFVTIADVDGDGRSDLVAAGITGDGVAIHRGLGDGTFQPRLDFGTGHGPTGVAVGDVTGDGRADVVTVEYFGGTMTVLANLLPAILPPPTVSAMSPASGGNTGPVTVRVAGADFQIGATVRLTSATQPDIVASPVAVAGDGRSLQVTFNLAGKVAGLRTLQVQNPDGGTGTLGGFNVTSGTGSTIAITIVGPTQVRAGRARTFELFFNNTGNVDANGIPLWIVGLPATATLSWDPAPGAVSSLGGEPDWSTVPAAFSGYTGNAAVQWLSRIPPGVSSRRLRIQTPPGFSGTFTLGASLTRGWPNTAGFRGCMDDAAPSPGPIAALNAACMGTQLDAVRNALLAAPGMTNVNGIGLWAAIADRCEGVNGLGPSLAEAEAALDYMVYTIEFGVIQPGCTDLVETTQNALSVTVGTSEDPNDKLGPLGFTAAHYVAKRPLPYEIRFENVETATLDAAEIILRDTLDAGLDPATFAFGPILFGDRIVVPPPGLAPFVDEVDLRPARNVLVRITAVFAPGTRVATWTLLAIDPATGEPSDDGFLPPNTTPPAGEGRVSYTVAPLASLATGVTIRNRALIAFDDVPMLTPEWLNTVDATNPVSAVVALATVQGTPVPLTWSGSDVGSGVRTWDVFVAVDGGSFVPWAVGIDTTAALFHGQTGHSYAFYTVATDSAGNREDAPGLPDATTTIAGPLDVASEGVAFALEGALENPSPRSLAVAFSLPGAGPASLELFDVQGRRILRREVGSLGSGRHVIPIGAGRQLRAGFYMIRLTRSDAIRTATVTLLD